MMGVIYLASGSDVLATMSIYSPAMHKSWNEEAASRQNYRGPRLKSQKLDRGNTPRSCLQNPLPSPPRAMHLNYAILYAVTSRARFSTRVMICNTLSTWISRHRKPRAATRNSTFPKVQRTREKRR